MKNNRVNFLKSLIKEAFDKRPEIPVDIEKKAPLETNPVNVTDNVGPPLELKDEEIPIGSSLITRGDKMTRDNKVEELIRKEVRNLLDDMMPSSKKTLKENVRKLMKRFNLSREDASIIMEHPQIIEDTPGFKKFLNKR